MDLGVPFICFLGICTWPHEHSKAVLSPHGVTSASCKISFPPVFINYHQFTCLTISKYLFLKPFYFLKTQRLKNHVIKNLFHKEVGITERAYISSTDNLPTYFGHTRRKHS
jgi:hypothetical protein